MPIGPMLMALACGTASPRTSANPDAGVTPGPPSSTALAINAVMADNDGAWIDETGEADDWIELINRGKSIHAILLLRSRPGLGLAEGKEAVVQFERRSRLV